jgi:lipoprotein-releasing system permease protein
MGFPLDLALRYLQSKKRAFVSVGTIFAILGVLLGVAALTTVMSVTGGFREEFRQKVLGVNAHVLVLKYSADFREYRDVMKKVAEVPGVTGVAPFVINPMMVTHGENTATGVLLKGIDPGVTAEVLDLPQHIVEPAECSLRSGGNPQRCLERLRLPGTQPPRPRPLTSDEFDAPTGKLDAGERLGPGERDVRASDKGLLNELDRVIEDAGAFPSGPASSGLAASPSGAPAASLAPPGSSAGRAPAAGGSEIPAEAIQDAMGESAPPAAPAVSATPAGGFASRFSDDEDTGIALTEDLAPDPCKGGPGAPPLPGIAIGSTLKENLKAKIGDCLRVTSPTIGFTLSRDAIRPPIARQYRVIAVFDAGFDQYDAKLVYTDLFEAQAFSDSGDSVTGVEMKVADIDRARDVKEAIDEKLANGIYHTMDWEELNHGLFTALQIQQIMMSMVLGLIIIVAAFTVIATLIMVVLEKKKEIAVLKAMGATDFAVLRAFLYQGAMIGVIGTGIGLALGYAACRGLLAYGFPLDAKVYFISRLPVRVVLGEFILVGVFAVAVCLVATVWPALYAARLRPAEAFREQ